MKHITLESTQVTRAQFDIDDKYTLKQIKKFIDLEDGKNYLSKTNDEILADLRSHGVKIHKYASYSDHDPSNIIHIFTEDWKDLLNEEVQQ